MLFTAHALSGGAVGELIGNPFWAFLLGFVIHFILDAIPHYDTTDNGKYTPRQIILAGVDFIIGVLIIIFIIPKYSYNFYSYLWGVLGSITPDLLSLIPWVRNITSKIKYGKKFHDFHHQIQSIKISPLPGILIQVVIWFLSLWILIVK